MVYDTASGDTHHLTPAAALVLQLLGSSPRTTEELANCVLSSDPLGKGGENPADVDSILTHLANLGLIEPAQH